eukprot:scaffold97925_cov19-Prasinocladus_malaysianus.AAC.1
MVSSSRLKEAKLPLSHGANLGNPTRTGSCVGKLCHSARSHAARPDCLMLMGFVNSQTRQRKSGLVISHSSNAACLWH